MKHCFFFAVLIVATLASGACYVVGPASPATPATPGSASLVIERERSQVWRQSGGGEGEVLASVEGHTGDQVWTRQRGQALLRWPDLHIRLYGDDGNQTGLVLKDATPTWLRLGLAAGAAQVTGKPVAGQRVELTTDNARVELIGTSIMLAYHPGAQISIVRVFQGQVEVSSLADPAAVRPVRADQWALVRREQAVEVSSRLEDMRALARELGLWDLFHDIELDARAGFGPENSRVPPGAVEIVFVEQIAQASPSPDRATATRTPTRAPTRTPTSTPTRTPTPTATPLFDATQPLAACVTPAEVAPGDTLRLIVLNIDAARERRLELVFVSGRSRQVFQHEVPRTLSTVRCPGTRGGPGLTIEFTGEAVDVGDWQVFVRADPTGRRADTAFRVMALPAGQPDLTVQIVGIDRDRIVQGAEPWTWITYRVVNRGDAAAPAGVRLRAWSNDEPRSGYMTVDQPIEPGAAVEQRFAVGHDAGWPPGEYSLFLEVDYLNQMPERDEGNNRSNPIGFLVVPPEEERQASIEDFICDWRNVDTSTSGTTRLNINWDYSQTYLPGSRPVMVHGYGKCTPTDCDWGSTPAYLEGSTLVAQYEFSFKEVSMMMTREEDLLRLYSVNTFTDGSGRDYSSTEYFYCALLR